MSYTMEDFKRDYVKEHFAQLTPQEREEVLRSLPPEERLAGLSPEQIRQYLERLTGRGTAASSNPAIGVAYAGQEISSIPHQAHDRTLDMVLTERGVRHFR